MLQQLPRSADQLRVGAVNTEKATDENRFIEEMKLLHGSYVTRHGSVWPLS